MIIKKKYIFFFILSFIFSISFWYIRDINSVIFITDSLGSVSDLSRYYNLYLNPDSKTFETYSDVGYKFANKFFSNIGLSFQFILFAIIYMYYQSFTVTFYKITKSDNLIFYILLLLILSLWLISMATIALRQGIAFLIIFMAFCKGEDSTIYKKIFFVFLATTFHFSVIFYLPLLIFENFFFKRIKNLNYFFTLIFILYIFNFFVIFQDNLYSILNLLDIDLRSLEKTSNRYAVGPTFFKSLAIIFPFILINFYKLNNFIISKIYFRIYLFFIAGCTLGMIFSGFPYHDRIMLYGWIFSPFLICLSILNFPLKLKV